MKKNSSIIAGTIIVLAMATFTSCRKYDEGGKLRKAEDNLTTEWIMERAFKDGGLVEEIDENPQIGEVTEDWVFNSDGSMRTEDGTRFLYGTWELKDKKRKLEVAINDPISSTQTYEIMQLDEDKMIWEHTLNGKLYRYELKSAR